MANIRKTFNFRNGVQVDEDNLVVNSSGLVGIGTSVPTEVLDVRGTAKVIGLVTATEVGASLGNFSTSIDVGSSVNIDGNTGVVSATKFYGDASGLSNIYAIAVDGWIVEPVGLSTLANVGIGTTTALSTKLLVVGDTFISGLVTATEFYGSGVGISSVNASNIDSGTLNNDRLPTSIQISGILTSDHLSSNTLSVGISTLTTFESVNGSIDYLSNINLISGISTISNLVATVGTISTITTTNLNSISGIVTTLLVSTLNSGFSTVTTAYINTATVEELNSSENTLINITNTNLNTTGIGTINQLRSNEAIIGLSTITTLTSTTGTIDSLTSINSSIDNLNSTGINVGVVTANEINSSLINVADVNISGITTVGFISATSTYFNSATAESLEVNNIRLGTFNPNLIDTLTGNLVLDSDSDIVQVDSNLDVTGVSTFNSPIYVDNQIFPFVDLNTSIGSSTQRFSSAYINQIRVGASGTTKIDTESGNLILSATDGVVEINDLLVTGIGTFDNLFVNSGILPDQNYDAFIGQSGQSFREAYIGYVTVGVGQSNLIKSTDGDLQLGAQTTEQQVRILNSNLLVDQDSYLTGITTIGQTLLPLTDKGAGIGETSKSFNFAYINEVRIGVGNSGDITTRSGDLVLDGNSQSVVIANNFNVTGITTFSSSILPPSDANSVSIGDSTKSFNSAFINEIQIGSSGTSIIDTRTGNLILDSQTGLVVVNQDLYVAGIATFSDINLGNNTLVVDSANQRVGIGSTLPSQTLSIVGDSIITGNLFVGENNFIVLDGLSDTVTVKNLIVTGSTTGVTAVGSGISVGILESSNSGTVNLLVFTEDFLLSPIETGISTISLSPNIGIGVGVTIGIGTNIIDQDDVKLYVLGDTYISNTLFVGESVSATNGFSSGIGTPVTIDGLVAENGEESGLIFSGVGVGTVIIPVSTEPDYVLVMGAWESSDPGYSTLSNVGIGTTNPTSALTVSGDTSITGVTTSVGGFTSGIGVTDPVQITVSGNVLTFTVAGVGSTSLTLY